MKKICWFLTLVLLLGCFAGCQAAPEAQPSTQLSIENEDGTLSDWMKEEMNEAHKQKMLKEHGYENADFGSWWSPDNPRGMQKMYYGTYDGYVMYCINFGAEVMWKETYAGYEFIYPSMHILYAYKDGEFFEFEDLLNQGILGEEAVAIAHEHYTEITRIQNEARDSESTDN